MSSEPNEETTAKKLFTLSSPDSSPVSSAKSSPSFSSFARLTNSPLCPGWTQENKENFPIPKTPGSGGSSKLFKKFSISSPSTPVARPLACLASPSNVLKRPLTPIQENDTGSAFQIKRRKGMFIEADQHRASNDELDECMSVASSDLNRSIGASPNLCASGNTSSGSPPTPVLKPSKGPLRPSKITMGPPRPALHRSYSEANAAYIMRSCHRADTTEDLAGDFESALSLPVMKKGTKHQDLNTIDCHTMAKLLRGEFADRIGSYRIVDARYIYEYQGGHIRGAENFGKWDEQVFFDEFLPSHLSPVKSSAHVGDGIPANSETDKKKKKKQILIFHCEFSSARGPALMRELRKRDRLLNSETYPALHYPECYLLHNGYKEFYENYPELCDPRSYQPMNDPNFSSQEKMFRKKAKTWTAGGSVARTAGSSRVLKL